MITVTVASDIEYADSLAYIMIAAWRSGFRGILPDTVIENYTAFPNVKAMFSQLLASDAGTMYLASLNEKPVGLLYWLDERGCARIEALLTIPEVWGKGVSSALMNRALEDVKDAGYSAIHVWPFAKNHRARRFYEKHGFHSTDQIRTGDAAEIEYICYL